MNEHLPPNSFWFALILADITGSEGMKIFYGLFALLIAIAPIAESWKRRKDDV